jgi:outer membrane protein OmpA-like peptidoglycan-associated protein
MGEYDIFRTVIEDGNWTVPENLGWPINTPGKDIFFVLSADSKTGYYASERPGGLGYTDLYRITIQQMDSLGEEQTKVAGLADDKGADVTHSLKPVKSVAAPIRSAAAVLLVKGIVSDATTKMPIGAKIQVVDNATGETVSEIESNSATGEYLVVLPKNKNYGMTVTAPDYLFHSENFYLPDNQGYSEFVKDVALGKATAGARVVLRNVFFDTNKSTLRKESKSELEKLLKLMKEMATLKLEISGHTDNVGAADYNKKLSQERAQAVVTYLTEKGIAKERLTYEGYGFDRPIAPNDTEANRQLNRRTEFEVK